jgi:hypothetical protein
MPQNTDTFDDIFGSSPSPSASPPPTHTAPPPPTAPPPEPSDLPSLRRQHVTTGYREGISASKGTHIQDGFDAGFPVGAQLGMRAGTVLGILEGLVRGFEGDAAAGVVKKRRPQQMQRRDGGDGDDRGDGGGEGRKEKRERILKTYRAAVKELQVEAVFAGLDGEALSGQGQGPGQEKKKKPQEELARKGDAALAGWEERVSVARWEENMDTLETREKDGHGHGDVGSDGKQGLGRPGLAASS